MAVRGGRKPKMLQHRICHQARAGFDPGDQAAFHPSAEPLVHDARARLLRQFIGKALANPSQRASLLQTEQRTPLRAIDRPYSYPNIVAVDDEPLTPPT